MWSMKRFLDYQLNDQLKYLLTYLVINFTVFIKCTLNMLSARQSGCKQTAYS